MQKNHLSLVIILLTAVSCTANECYSCNKSSQVLLNPITEREAIDRARCLSTCVDKLSSYSPFYTYMEPNLEGQWYSFSFGQLYSNCTAYQMISDCQRGCAIRSRNSSLTESQCGSQCVEQCPKSTKYKNTECDVSCGIQTCSYGCEIYINDVINANVSNLTSLPLVLPALSPYGVGKIVYNVGPSSNHTSSEIKMTAFVFKVVTKTNNSYYFWQATSSGFLNLEFLTCENVSISYKAITENSTTNYSHPTFKIVNGLNKAEQYPGRVNNKDINFYYKEDFRQNYTGHAVTTISWKAPDNAEFISHYKLTVYSQLKRCGGILTSVSYCIDKNATDITITASSPDKPIFFRCVYFVRLFTEPRLNDSQVTEFTINPESVSDPPPTLVVHCKREHQPNGKFTLYASWNIANIPGLLEAIEKYTVSPQLVDLSFTPTVVVESYSIIDIIPQVDQPVNVALVRNLLPLENMERKYKLRVDVVSNHIYPWRHMPRYASCIIDSHPEPPSSINSSDITVHDLILTDINLFLNVSWQYPTVSNGNITEFMIRLGHNPLSPSENEDPTEYSYTQIVEGVKTEVVIDTSAIYQIKEVTCIYLQIQSKNDYLWSNWSNPIPLSKYPQDPYCASSFIPTLYPTASPKEVTSDNGVSQQVLGGVIGTIFALLLIAVLCTAITVLCRRYRRRNRYLEAFKDVHSEAMYIKGPVMSATSPLESPRFDEWEIPASQVMIEKQLGEGCFGEVYQGIIKGPISNPKVQASLKNVICPTVAIKLLKSTATGSEKVDFLQEIETMKSVSKGNNPHVVNMVGCVTIQEPLCLITEFVKHGDLLSYLQSIRKMVTKTPTPSPTIKPGDSELDPYMLPLNDYENDEKRKSIAMPHPESIYADLGGIDAVNLLSFAYQIASGMEFLASLGIVHRDLACRNILVDEGKSLKISDFGMSRTVANNDIYVKNTRGRLPWKWMAIESIVNREFTTASDVWAYGVTLWEIATLGGFPYPVISNNQLLEHLQKGLRLEKPDNCSQDVYEIMLECWMVDPHNRPTFTSLRAKFDSLISSQQGHVPYIDLDIDSCKPYYAVVDNSDDEEKRASSESSEVSAESSSLPRVMDGYEVIRPNTADDLPRPVSNTYVDTPTKVNPYELPFGIPGGDPCPSSLDSPIKKELQMTEVA